MNQLPFKTIVEFDLQKTGDMIEIMYWLTVNVSYDNWEPEKLADTGRIIGLSFRNEEDATAFKLKFRL